MIGLFGLGVLHAVFFFLGDILMIYACFGSALFLFKNLPASQLLAVGISCLIFQVVIILFLSLGLYELETLSPDADRLAFTEDIARQVDRQMEVFQTGGFIEASQYRLSQIAPTVFGAFLLQGFASFGYFPDWICAYEEGVFSRASCSILALLPTDLACHRPFWQRCCRFPVRSSRQRHLKPNGLCARASNSLRAGLSAWLYPAG